MEAIQTDPRLAPGTPGTFRVRFSTENGAGPEPKVIREFGRELKRLTPIGVDVNGFSVYAVGAAVQKPIRRRRKAHLCARCSEAI